MARKVLKETTRLLGEAGKGRIARELTELAWACSESKDDGTLSEVFVKAGGLEAIGVVLRVVLDSGRERGEVCFRTVWFEDEIHALLFNSSLILKRCHKQILKNVVESPFVECVPLACAEESNPGIGIVTASADIVGSLAAACDYNALRGVELGLLDSVLRAAKNHSQRAEKHSHPDSESGVPKSLEDIEKSDPRRASVTRDSLSSLDRSVMRALIASGLDVPRQPRGRRRGVRILCLDGGGTRALASLEMLREIERQASRPIYELFDLIGGTSSGGVLALALGLRMRSAKDCEEVYKAMASRVFSRGTRVLSAGRLLLMNKGQYNTAALEKVLRDALGSSVLVDTRLDDPSCPRVFIVSTLMSSPTALPYLHANYRPPPRPPGSGEHRYRHGCHHMLWEAARASTAVPSYFDAFRSGGEIFCDGAILVNNPAAIAVHEARLLWPNAPLECIVSVGTGRYDLDTHMGGENLYDVAKALINSATDTEAVHHALEDLAPQGVYFRFNPLIPRNIGSDETRKNVLEDVQEHARQYVVNNREQFQELTKLLADSGSLDQQTSTKNGIWWPGWKTRL